MKKILVVLIALLALTAFVACDSNPSPAPGPSPAPEPEEVTITFTANYEGSEDEDYTQTVEAGVATDLDANEFEREQYVFVAWNTEADGTGDSYEDEANINTSEDVTLYAQWKDELAGTKWLCETTFDYGQEVYAVIGIITDDDNGVYFSQCVFEDASYENYIYGYSQYGEYEVSMDDQDKHVSIILPDFGYEFDYEIIDGQLICTGEDEEYNFDPKEDTATITFMSGNEEDDPVEQIVIADAKTALLPNSFTKGGQIFYSWADDAEDPNYYYDGDVVEISEDITLTAQWGMDFNGTTWTAEIGGIYFINIEMATIENEPRLTINVITGTGSITYWGPYAMFKNGEGLWFVFSDVEREETYWCNFTINDETHISIDLSDFDSAFTDPVVFTKVEI